MIYSGRSTNFYNLEDLATIVAATVLNLQPHLRKFDFIVVQGMSGVLVGAPVSLMLGKPLVVVRKPGEPCHHVHSGHQSRILGAEGIKGYRRGLFLDDFIAGGNTRDRCRRAINEREALLVAIYTYETHRWEAIPKEDQLR